MKTYIFTTKYTRATYGRNFTLTIYRIKNNAPQYVTEWKGNTGSMRGLESEAFNALINCGEIPKSYYHLSSCSWRGPGYYCSEVKDKGIQIISL